MPRGWRTLYCCWYSQLPRRAWPCCVRCCRNDGHTGCGAVARLCLTLPRMTPRLRVLILISPFKFLWYDQQHEQANFPSASRELYSALARSLVRSRRENNSPTQSFAIRLVLTSSDNRRCSFLSISRVDLWADWDGEKEIHFLFVF